jgi:hypothetical protein
MRERLRSTTDRPSSVRARGSRDNTELIEMGEMEGDEDIVAEAEEAIAAR